MEAYCSNFVPIRVARNLVRKSSQAFANWACVEISSPPPTLKVGILTLKVPTLVSAWGKAGQLCPTGSQSTMGLRDVE